jgi:hypothetical protein
MGERSINPILNVHDKYTDMFIINPYRFGVVANLLLDTYTGATGAYSLRKIKAGYSGNCIEVRRSSDNTTQNIGFSNGVLDESALTTFVGAGDGFVKTWYDQSGNNNHVTQATTSRQPLIVSSGTVRKVNSKPSVYFGSDIRLAVTWTTVSQPFSVLCVQKEAYSGLIVLYNLGGSTMYGNSSNYRLFAGSEVSVQGRTSNQCITLALFNGSSSTMWINNSKNATDVNPGTGNCTGVSIGNHPSNSQGNSDIQELIVFPANKTDDASDINTAVNTFYSVY